jgi:APA family basic amino acid/polyamine antiporter
MSSSPSPSPSSNSSEATSHGFQRRLGLFDATMLIVGTMIGSGIFVTSPDIARDVGSTGWLLAIWILAGVMTLLGALSYTELAGMYPQAGGQYIFLKEAYSPLWGFLYGWTCFLVIQTGSIAAVGVAFAKFLGVLVPTLGTDNIIYTAANVNIQLFLPFKAAFLTDLAGNALPFFEMKDFTISAGQVVAVVVIAFLTWLNCRGIQEGKTVQNIMTIAKTLALAMLIIVGLFLVANVTARQMNWADPWGGIYSTERYTEAAKRVGSLPLNMIALMIFGGAMVGALFSADAWNNVTFVAGEMRNPRRNLPLSLAIGAGSVVILYVLANVAYVESLPLKGNVELATKLEKEAGADEEFAKQLAAQGKNAEAGEASGRANSRRMEAAHARGIDSARDDRVGTAVLELLSPQYAAPIMAIAIMISTFGCVNGMTLMGARLYYVMAQEGLFFRSVGTLNKRGVPAVALVLQGLWSILLVFSGTYNDLLDYVIFAVLIFYTLTVIGLYVLRRTRPHLDRPVKAFGYPVLPAVYVVLCAAIMIDLLIVKPKFTWPGLAIVLTGVPVYFLWRLTRGKVAA